MNVNEAKSQYAQALLNRIKEDRDALAVLGMDPNKAVDWSDPRKIDVRTADVHVWNPTAGDGYNVRLNIPVEVTQPTGKTHGDAIAEVRKRGRKAKGKRVRRSADTIEATGRILLAHVRQHPGQRGEQIAAALNTTVSTMRKPMKALIAKRLVKTSGQRRGMVYTATKKGGGK